MHLTSCLANHLQLQFLRIPASRSLRVNLNNKYSTGHHNHSQTLEQVRITMNSVAGNLFSIKITQIKNTAFSYCAGF
ncbi:hypothetical protein NIES4101_50730 [Calothrix sp. NIES-4101]|nr:hypothetical protein NIES4101_50730 [Calothrix sp. NIES-4101]